MKLIIFDFDGTLADTETIIVSTMTKSLHEMGLPPATREQIRATIGLPLREAFLRLAPLSADAATAATKIYERIFMHDVRPDSIPLFPNVKETLQKLKASGLTLSIATSRQRPSLMQLLNAHGVAALFSHIVTVNDVERAKPYPDMVLSTLQKFQTEPGEAMMVGDAVYDIQMGTNAGVHTCGVTYGNGSRQQMEECHAEHIIDNFATLTTLLLP